MQKKFDILLLQLTRIRSLKNFYNKHYLYDIPYTLWWFINDKGESKIKSVLDKYK